MVPGGKNRHADSSERAPSRMSCGPMSWARSTRRASGQMRRITPFTIPTNGSRRPKSLVSVTIGAMAVRSCCRAARPEPASSAVAVHDEVRDQRQRLLVLRVLERSQRALGALDVLVSSLERVVDPLVFHDQAADLFDLVAIQGMALEQCLDARP